MKFPKASIRRAISSDAQGIHEAHMKSIQELCSKDYTPAQIAAWGGRPFNLARRLQDISNDFVWVIESNKKIEGFGHFKSFSRDGKDFGAILGLYFTPEVKGLGLGRELVRLMEETSRSLKLFRVELQSTLTSQEFYKKMGYKRVGDELRILIGGVEVPCYPMEKDLRDALK